MSVNNLPIDAGKPSTFWSAVESDQRDTAFSGMFVLRKQKRVALIACRHAPKWRPPTGPGATYDWVEIATGSTPDDYAPVIAVAQSDAGAESTQMFIMAAVVAVAACGILISGLHPRWRTTATWRGGYRRSIFGSVTFSMGLLLLCLVLAARGMLGQQRSPAEVLVYICVAGAALMGTGVSYDLGRSVLRFVRGRFGRHRHTST